MNKNIKMTLIVLIGIFILVTVVGLIYGMQNRSQVNDIYASYSESILTTVDNSIKLCQNVFEEASATEDELNNLNDYITNINDAESPVLKGYIADSMLDYASELMTVKQQLYNLGQEDIQKANYSGILERIVSQKTSLTSARAYGGDAQTTQAQN